MVEVITFFKSQSKIGILVIKLHGIAAHSTEKAEYHSHFPYVDTKNISHYMQENMGCPPFLIMCLLFPFQCTPWQYFSDVQVEERGSHPTRPAHACNGRCALHVFLLLCVFVAHAAM